MRLVKRPGVEREVPIMDALRAVGLAWIVAAPTVASAQTTAPSPLPPIRLPGIAYPAPADAADPPQLPRAGSLAVVNGRGIPVAAVTVVMETETVRHVEPLTPNAQAVLRLPQIKGCVATIEAVFEGGERKVKLVRLIE